jgi:hypothetical protein
MGFNSKKIGTLRSLFTFLLAGSNQHYPNICSIELQEKLNQIEARQNQQETRISWLESKVNSILGWIKSFL